MTAGTAEDVVIRITAKNLVRAGFQEAARDVTAFTTTLKSGAEAGASAFRSALGGAATSAKTAIAGVGTEARAVGTKLTQLGTDGKHAFKQLGDGANEAKSRASGLKDIFSTAVGTMGGFIGGSLIMRGLGSAFDLAKGAAIGMNASLETSELQFATLMGDSQRAKQHVADLFEFAKKTPFETGPIIEASRKLHTFGGDALNTMKTLTLVGDAAAGVSAPINEVGFHVGRLYGALKNGQPFGEAALRLQELAILSGPARQQMEAMQKAGKGVDEIFAVLTDDLGKFDGAMVKQASTWEGVTSTLSDSVNMLLADTLRPFFEAMRDGIGAINDLMASDAFNAGAKKMAEDLQVGVRRRQPRDAQDLRPGPGHGGRGRHRRRRRPGPRLVRPEDDLPRHGDRADARPRGHCRRLDPLLRGHGEDSADRRSVEGGRAPGPQRHRLRPRAAGVVPGAG